MAECWELRVVDHIVSLEPPLAKQWSNEWSDNTTNVDKYVEDLETRVTLILSSLQRLLALLCSLSLEVVVHLTYDSLQVTLEQTVTKGDDKESQTGKWQQPADVCSGGKDRNREQHITCCHNHQTRHNSTLVVLGLIGDITTYKSQDVDTGVEE